MECVSYSLAESLGPLQIHRRREQVADEPKMSLVDEFDEEDDDEEEFNESNPSSSQPSTQKASKSKKRQEKPPYSYIALIAMAISKRPDKKATLAEIYTYLQENFEFFRGEYAGWRNSIRHNLSLNECFVKLPKDTAESYRGRKGHKWTLSEQCDFLLEDNGFRRRPRGYKARKRAEEPKAVADELDEKMTAECLIDGNQLHANSYSNYFYSNELQWSPTTYDTNWYYQNATGAGTSTGSATIDYQLSSTTSITPQMTPQVSPYFYPPAAFDDWRFYQQQQHPQQQMAPESLIQPEFVYTNGDECGGKSI